MRRTLIRAGSTNNIVEFGAQKILSDPRETNTPQRATVWCGFWAVIWKWGWQCCNFQLFAVPQHDNRILVALPQRYGSGRHVVPAGRRYLPHHAWNNPFIGGTISRPNHLPKFWCQLATEIVWFDAVWFLPLGFCEISRLCQCATDYSRTQGRVQRVIDELEAQICENVIENFMKRARVCVQNHGGAFVGFFILYLIGTCLLYIAIKISPLAHKLCVLF